MRSGNRIAIVGAGIAGLVCAKVLTEDGFAVEVFDRAPDIGGVWSETRRYPGLRAQSSKNTYHFSDHPMPADYPRVLDGARMQEYLASYVRAFGLTGKLRLRTEVVAADPVDGGWLLEIRDIDGVHRTSCDHLVIANGVFSEPEVPEFAGATEFARAGGQLGHSTQFLDVEAVRDRSVVVVGYGVAACDLATEISRVAAGTTVVARRLMWKMPRRPAAGLDAERLLLTRTGAAHFRHPEPGRFERLLHGPGRSFRESNLDLVEALVAERSGAAELGLVPDGRFERAPEAAFGLASDGFADQVRAGRIIVRGQTRVAGLGGDASGPYAELSDGQRVRADIVVCATGFQQRVPFLTPYVQRQLTDDHGNFRLYRQILPLGVPHLTFAGYNSSLLSAVGAEVGAHWTAALLTGALTLPPDETMTERIDARLRLLGEHTGGRHAHGCAVTPHAIREIDELLADLGVRLPAGARAAQWVRPVRPGDFKVLSRRKRGPVGPPYRQATAPAKAAEESAPQGGQPAPAGEQRPAVEVPADSPTVQIPGAAVAANAAAQ
ncbi:FAD-dependent oxidoreductase, partial [Nocardia sp. NPDC003345]